MRGQSLACSVAEALPSCSPRRLLARHGSVRQSSLALLPARSHRLGTAFRSPATTVLFREPPWRGQRSRPIPSALILNLSSSPFGLGLPPSATFFTPPGVFHAQNPLPSFKPKTLKRPSNFRSPSGLSSFRIEALGQRLSLRSLPFMRGPIFLRSPPSRLRCVSHSCGEWGLLAGSSRRESRMRSGLRSSNQLSGPNIHALPQIRHRRSGPGVGALHDRGPNFHFHCAHEFSTRTLAGMLDSLVRVTRRVV